MASDGFLPKRRKVEHSTNGEPVHVELKLLWALIFTRKLRRLEDIVPSAGLTMHISASRNFNFEQNLSL